MQSPQNNFALWLTWQIILYGSAKLTIQQTVAESRTEDRVTISFPVCLDDTQCVTRDVSASGVYFESNGTFDIGERVDFVIEFDSPGGKLILKCNGAVVRVEKQNGKVGVAVKIERAAMGSKEGLIYMDSNINVLSSSCRVA